MDFTLSEAGQRIRETAREFAEAELAPVAAEIDQTGSFPRELAERLGEVGFTGGTLPEEYGGAGLEYTELVSVIAQLARFSTRAATIAGWPSCSLGEGTMRYGSERLKQEYIAPTARGELFGAQAVTEPHSGTDVVRNLETTAERDGDAYRIDGTKAWISNLDLADWLVTFAQLDEDAEPSYRGTIAVIIETDWDGVELTPERPIMGERDLCSGRVDLDAVRVPIENRVGEEGEGYKVLMAGTELGRLACAARAVGKLDQCLRESVEYATEREVFDQPIGEYQLVQQKIADMKTGYEASRLLTLWLADLIDRGAERAQQEAAIAKRFTTNAAQEAAADAVQLHGANGVSETAQTVARHYRDTKVDQIYDGTNDVQTVIIGEHELGYR
ncbi:MAG: acyl-CoA dehydrogenase family protein [Salinirussus sp.]